jgi:hypothetical protein
MASTARVFLLCGLWLCACSHDEAPPPGGKSAPAHDAPKSGSPPKAQPTDLDPKGGQAQAGYAGPPLQAAFEGQGQERQLRVTVSVPAAGYELHRDRIEQRGDTAVLSLTLNEPDPDKAAKQPGTVAHAVSMKDLVPDGSTVTSVRVEVAEVVPSRPTFIAPPHLLAATLAMPR